MTAASEPFVFLAVAAPSAWLASRLGAWIGHRLFRKGEQ